MLDERGGEEQMCARGQRERRTNLCGGAGREGQIRARGGGEQERTNLREGRRRGVREGTNCVRGEKRGTIFFKGIGQICVGENGREEQI